MQELIGRTLGHYRIVEKIGEGGMGEVYRAHDERLDRDVAVKVLPEAVAQDPDRIGRFKREAQAVAKLDHPNILAIHDFGMDGGATYSVTELLEGEDLRQRLAGGALGWRKSAKIGAAISEGLAAAHGAGIIHRDIKPANIFITSDGRVKILDFGLARDVETVAAGETDTPTVTRYTNPGAVMGTAGYMSPEQVRGQEVDHRSDVFALGCVLYEMVSGCGPFRQDEAADCQAAILRDDPAPLTGGVHEVIGQIVFRCLEKNPGERYQSAGEVAVALRTLAAATSRPLRENKPEAASIAVLPFANLSPDPEQEYFCDGMTEEIISDLSKIGSLRVIARHSAMKFKGTDKDTRTIGRELGVRYVLNGSVRKAGDSIRMTAQLIDAESEAHLWAEKCMGTLDEVFEIQERFSRGIVEALKIQLTATEDRKIAERPLANAQAYECYRKALHESLSGDEQGLERAVRHLEHGLKIGGENAVIYRGLSSVYLLYFDYGLRTDDATLRKAEKYARAVLRLDPNAADGHYLLGIIERLSGTATNALTHLRRAVDIDPNDSMALFYRSWLLALFAGKPSLAEPLVKRLLEIDPLTPVNYWPLAWLQMARQQLPAAIESLEKLVQAEPAMVWARFHRAHFLALLGRTDEALDQFENIQEGQTPGYESAVSAFAMGALRGEEEKALAAMTSDVEQFCWNDPEMPWFMADYYSLLDRKETALLWLERAVDRGWVNYPLFAEHDPFLAGLRGEERFERLLARVKHEWETFEDEEEPVHRTSSDDSTQPRSLIARRWPHVLAVVIAVVAAFLFLLPPQGLFERATSEQVSDAPPRIVVLPFENLGSPDDKYFADGITDEVRGKLISLTGLEVIARFSSDQFRGTNKTFNQIAEELGASYLLTANVRWQKADDGSSRIRVSPELVKVNPGAAPVAMWHDAFDATLADVFRVQADIATSVAHALDVTLSAEDEHALQNRPTDSLAAYDAFLQAEQMDREGVGGGKRKHIGMAKLYERAVALDPEFALAWARLSYVESAAYLYGGINLMRAESARRAAERAIEIDPSLPEARLAMALYLRFIGNDREAAEQMASGLDGVDDPSLGWRALNPSWRREDELAHLERAAELDPLYSAAADFVGLHHLQSRRWGDAQEWLDRAYSLAPTSLEVIWHRTLLFLAQGDLEGARNFHRVAQERVELTELVAYLSTYSDLYWVLDDEWQELLFRLGSEPFGGEIGGRHLGFAHAHHLRGEREQMLADAEMAREDFTRRLEELPDEAQLHSYLGSALAYLGQKAEATNHGRRGLELSRNSGWDDLVLYLQLQLVRINLILGESEAALDLLEPLLETPTFFLSPAWLTIDPMFDPLRDHPRFQAVLEKYEVNQ